LFLCIFAGSDGGVVGVADVGELVTEGVGDDVWVEGFGLAAAGYGVRDLEGEFVGGTAVFAALEGYGWGALAKVCSAGGGIVVAVAGVLLVVVVTVTVVIVAVVIAIVCLLVAIAVVAVAVAVTVTVVAIVGFLVAVVITVTVIAVVVVIVDSVLSTVTSCATLLVVVIVVGLLVAIVGLLIAIVGLLATSITLVTTRSRTTSTILGSDNITKTSSVEQIEHTHAISIKRRSSTALTERSNRTVDIDIRVDKRSDTTELRRNRERSITTDILYIVIGKRIGVLLRRYHANSSNKGVGTSTKFSEDLVGTGELSNLVSTCISQPEIMFETYLVARVCSTQKIRDGGAGNGRSSTSITSLNSANGLNGNLFLTESSLDVGDNRRQDETPGNHDCFCDLEYSNVKKGPLNVRGNLK
jgi:hypothetical protein